MMDITLGGNMVNMVEKKESTDNTLLASSCEKEQAACCKDGHVFLPKSEYLAIIEYLASRSEGLREFISRITDRGDFLLYNQKTRCQFLQSDERCELHHLGIKPSECFWWPAHVYLVEDDSLEIRVAECCSGCSLIQPDSSHVKKVAEQARVIGLPVLREFRRAHSYGKNYRVVAKF
jgi:Fe-S-cluster containining protein